jgi:hypothetical protein
MRKRLIFVGALLTGVTGCERVISVTLPESPTRLVVEARLERVTENVTGAQQLRLTTTSPYLSGTVSPAARGATVTVTDDSTRVVTPFAESTTDPGLYRTTNLIITPGRPYTLRITYAGEQFQATERMASTVPIDTLYFAPRNTNGPGGSAGLRTTIGFRDPRGTLNGYAWDMYVDGRRIVSPDTAAAYRAFVLDDVFDGIEASDYQPYDAIAVRSGQLVRVRQMGISVDLARYYQALFDQATANGSPFGSPPASLRGNIANLTKPTVPALGFFSISQVYEREARVP